MNKILTIYSSKGGVGKTTLAINIASILDHLGFKVLLIDTDPQNSISGVLGLTNYSGLSELNSQPLETLIQHVKSNLYVLPSGIGAIEETNDYILWMLSHRESILESIIPLKSYFDFIIIDTPPGFSPMAEVSLEAADIALSVLEADATSYATLELMERALIKIKKRHPEKLIYFITNKVFADEISVNFETIYRYLFESIYLFALPFDSNIKDATSHLQTLQEYNTLSPLYQNLVQMLKKLFPDLKELNNLSP